MGSSQNKQAANIIPKLPLEMMKGAPKQVPQQNPPYMPVATQSTTKVAVYHIPDYNVSQAPTKDTIKAESRPLNQKHDRQTIKMYQSTTFDSQRPKQKVPSAKNMQRRESVNYYRPLKPESPCLCNNCSSKIKRERSSTNLIKRSPGPQETTQGSDWLSQGSEYIGEWPFEDIKKGTEIESRVDVLSKYNPQTKNEGYRPRFIYFSITQTSESQDSGLALNFHNSINFDPPLRLIKQQFGIFINKKVRMSVMRRHSFVNHPPSLQKISPAPPQRLQLKVVSDWIKKGLKYVYQHHPQYVNSQTRQKFFNKDYEASKLVYIPLSKRKKPENHPKQCPYCCDLFQENMVVPSLLQCGDICCQDCVPQLQLSRCPTCSFSSPKVVQQCFKEYFQLKRKGQESKVEEIKVTYNFNIYVGGMCVTRKGVPSGFSVEKFLSEVEQFRSYSSGETGRVLLTVVGKEWNYEAIKSQQLGRVGWPLVQNSTGGSNIICVTKG